MGNARTKGCVEFLNWPMNSYIQLFQEYMRMCEYKGSRSFLTFDRGLS